MPVRAVLLPRLGCPDQIKKKWRESDNHDCSGTASQGLWDGWRTIQSIRSKDPFGAPYGLRHFFHTRRAYSRRRPLGPSGPTRSQFFLDLVAVSQVMTTAYEQREKDVVTDMARACSFVNPKYLFCDVVVMFTCQGASEACTKVIHD